MEYLPLRGVDTERRETSLRCIVENVYWSSQSKCYNYGKFYVIIWHYKSYRLGAKFPTEETHLELKYLDGIN